MKSQLATNIFLHDIKEEPQVPIQATSEELATIKDNNKKQLDYWGIVASFICLIHCLFLPTILTFLNFISDSVFSYLNLSQNEEYFHYVMLPIILYIAISAFLPSYKLHKNIKPLIIGISGISLLSFSLISHGHDNELAGTMLSVTGSILIISAHLLNLLLSRKEILNGHQSPDCNIDRCNCNKNTSGTKQ